MTRILYFSFAVLILVLLSSLPFTLKMEVRCESQYGSCPSDVATQLERFRAQSFAKAYFGVKKTLSTNLTISNFSIQFKLPNILKVDLIVRKPLFALRDKKSGSTFLVSGDGKILSAAKETSLPIVYTDFSGKVGESVGETNLFALKLSSGVYTMYQVTTAEVRDNNLLVDLPGRIRVLFPLEGEPEVLLGSLRLIYSKISGGSIGSKYSEIDLRFGSPVLR